MTSRVFILQFSLAGGGAQTVGLAWGDGLARAGYEVTIVVINTGGAIPTVAKQVKVIDLSSLLDGRATSHSGRVTAFGNLVREHAPDVVIALETYPNLLALAAIHRWRLRVPLIISEHNVPSILLKREGLAQRAQMVLARASYRYADWTIAVSHAVATDLLVRYSVSPAHLSVLVNPALDAAESTRINGGRAPGHASRNTTQRPPAISVLVPARLVPQKRPHFAVDVVNKLMERGCEARLVWVGDGDPSLLRSTQSSNTARIDHEAWRGDWWELSDDSTVVLLPSGYEGLGNVLVQAAERNIPVATCSLALGVADAVAPGITGCLAPHDDASSLADAVEAAAALRRESGMQSWLDRFSGTTATRNLLDIFDRMGISKSPKVARK